MADVSVNGWIAEGGHTIIEGKKNNIILFDVVEDTVPINGIDDEFREKLNPVTPISGLTFVNIYGSSEACGMAPYISYRTVKVPTGGVQGVQLKDKHIEYIDAYNLGGWKVSNMSAKGIYISKNKKHY